MMVVADNLQMASPVVADALDRGDPEPLQTLVRRLVKAGARALDINIAAPIRRAPEQMRFCVDAVQQVCDLPLLIDTADPETMRAGLKACHRPPIINGFSLEPSKLESILPLTTEFGCDVIAYLLTPEGQVPPDAAARLSIAVELLAEAEGGGVDPRHLIIDPITVPIMWQNGSTQAQEVLETVKILPDLLGFPVRTIAGLSNLTAGRGHRSRRLLLERTYLAMLAAAGLDMVLLNVLHSETMATARAAASLTGNAVFAWEGL